MKPTIKKSLSYHDQVHQTLKEMIIVGDYKPGERLYEAKIAREFEVSRSPVREAIRTLEQEGLLILDDRSRIFVYKPSIKDAVEIYECRQVLESLAVSLATQHAMEEEIMKIEMIISRSHELYIANHRDSPLEILHLNSAYHDAIIHASKNKRLEKQLENLRVLTFFYRSMNVENRERCKEIIYQHTMIAEHIRNRDKSAAAKAMHDHIATDLSYLIKILAKETFE
ncbi:GntR family transcriptional regulator [Jeotgalibacillus soli]|uniref:HTH-type transcriptional regulator YdhC n=1 Tax=Jeotgalibacillus soli TaxID=889306 RepID=A0A0C2VCR5_9BACL|nr:GntR family transcriptional regulator [Jeotgalibacillus soli]KIL46747.1 HTH-type transcriptional regulator YdhC [Jeotgalibacillus soli]